MTQFLSLPSTTGHWANSVNQLTRFDVGAAESFTIAAWIRPTASGTFDVVATTGDGATSPTGLFLRASDATADRPDVRAIDADSTAEADSSVTLTVDDWAHLVLRLDRGDDTLKVFVDGTERGSADATGIGDVPADTSIGVGAQASSSGNIAGDIISVEYYVDAATDAEISTAAAGAPGTKLSGPTGTAGIFDAADFNVGDSDTDTAVDAQGNTWTINGVGSEIQELQAQTVLVHYVGRV